MKSLISAFVISMFLVVGVFAQDTMKQNDTMMKSTRQDTMMRTTRHKPSVKRRHHRRHYKKPMRHRRHRHYKRQTPNPNSIT